MSNETKKQDAIQDAYNLQILTHRIAREQDADGETLENVIELLGMREQMLRQLVMKAGLEELSVLMEEKLTNNI